jgi:1-phosphatidylinositol-3-phosphate 5-kinase
VTHAFRAQGSDRNRYADEQSSVKMDENFMEFTSGHPLPLYVREPQPRVQFPPPLSNHDGAQEPAKALMHFSIGNDTQYLSSQAVVDYSMLVGIDETRREISVGIIDYMRHYDLAKRIEHGVKTVGMIAGQAAPTIISPPQYRRRFRNAMDRFFAFVPSKYTEWVSENATQEPEDPQQQQQLQQLLLA